MSRPSGWTRRRSWLGTPSTTYVTGIVDVRAPRLLDVVAGRSAKALSDWVSAQPQVWREGIEVAALDPFRG